MLNRFISCRLSASYPFFTRSLEAWGYRSQAHLRGLWEKGVYKPNLVSLTACTIMATLLGSNAVMAQTAVPITRISFAGAGGNFSQRYGTFIVPDKDTSVSAYGGALTRYDVHVAKMMEITHFQWCQPRPNYQGVYYNYQANNGKVFMGQFYVSCAAAKKAVNTFGVGRPESTVIYDRDNASTVSIPVLDLNGSKIAQFKRLVQSIRPQCVDKLCPGDRI